MDENLLIVLFIILIVISIHCYNILFRQQHITIIQINNIKEQSIPNSKLNNLIKSKTKHNLYIEEYDYSKEAALWF